MHIDASKPTDNIGVKINSDCQFLDDCFSGMICKNMFTTWSCIIVNGIKNYLYIVFVIIKIKL